MSLVAAAELLLAEARRAEGPGVAKAVSRVDSLRTETHFDFVRACDQLEKQGVNHSAVANYFGVSRQCVSDWYHYGSHQRKQLPAYAIRGVEKLLTASLCGMVSNG